MDSFLKIEEVMKVTSLSKATIYRFVREGNFPRPLKLGRRSSSWAESEITEWIVSRFALREKILANSKARGIL
jgi:prophage regulatory protein